MPYQNITASLTDADKTNVLDKIKQIELVLPFLINLTGEERKTIFKMGDKSVSFVEKALEYATNNPHLVAPYTNVTELESDLNLAKQLAPIVQQVNSFAEKLNDTYMAAGSEAMVMASGFYNTVKNATKLNVPGVDAIYSDLKSRFVRSSKVEPNK